jgi:hypothetical protein
MDNLEQEWHQLRAMVMPQQSHSDSNNQATRISHTTNSGEEQGGQDVEPMEVEDNDPSQDEAQEAQTTNHPLIHVFQMCFFAWTIY